MGVNEVVVKTFNTTFAELSAKSYVEDLLVGELNAKVIIIGYDHRFGNNRSGSVKDLETYGKIFDFKVIEIPAQDINDVTVSSTKIRNALVLGDVITAKNYLGYNYGLSGKVITGKKIGRTLNYPTANLEIREPYKLIPKDGVYLVCSKINSLVFYGMMNIGSNPTIPNKDRSIEIHFFDFDGDLYGQPLTVLFLNRIRDEIRFDSIEALKAQLQKDEQIAKQFIVQIHDQFSF